MNISIASNWKKILEEEFASNYFKEIIQQLNHEKAKGKIIYPQEELIFNAFNLTAFNDVNVVIIGQDPYHNPDQAMGLSFSVPTHCKVPPSLKRIYKEIANDYEHFDIPTHGDLTKWAEQGVLLLNAMLTVEHKKAGAHRKMGWQSFTDAVIQKLSSEKTGIIFLLWGNFAKAKATLIDADKHYMLASPHPSPLAGNGFFGNQHFKKTNELLKAQNKTTINWQI